VVNIVFWPLADMLLWSWNVRFRGRAGVLIDQAEVTGVGSSLGHLQISPSLKAGRLYHVHDYQRIEQAIAPGGP
jgi:hypothetical protein